MHIDLHVMIVKESSIGKSLLIRMALGKAVNLGLLDEVDDL